MIKVRQATIADVSSIVALGKELRDHSAYAMKNFNTDKVYSVVTALIESETDIALVVEDEGEVFGYFLGGLTYEWFSDDLLAFDYSVYVAPKKRNGRAAIKLFKAFEKWAQEKGAVTIQVGITTQVNVTGNSRFYQFLGFDNGGVLFEKRL